MSEKTLSALAAFGVVALIPFSVMWRGFVLSVLWGWFMVPTFSLPALKVAPAIGLALVVSYLTHQYSKKGDEDGIGRAVAHAALVPAFALLTGWVVKLWM